jgi:predicted RNase H-like HicB family nuclease
MEIVVELEQEADGRWLAEAKDLPGVMTYGTSPEAAKFAAQALALRVVADRIEHGEEVTDPITISFVTK